MYVYLEIFVHIYISDTYASICCTYIDDYIVLYTYVYVHIVNACPTRSFQASTNE